MTILTDVLKQIGLSQNEAAGLLNVYRVTISDKARGDVKHVGDLLYVIATWPELTDDQRIKVKKRIAELRNKMDGTD